MMKETVRPEVGHIRVGRDRCRLLRWFLFAGECGFHSIKANKRTEIRQRQNTQTCGDAHSLDDTKNRSFSYKSFLQNSSTLDSNSPAKCDWNPDHL